MNKEVEAIMMRFGLLETYEYLLELKVCTVEDLALINPKRTTEMITLELGALEALGFILIKLGFPMKYICIGEQEGLDRYNRIFGK